MHDTTPLVTKLADIYIEFLREEGNPSFNSFEDKAIRLGNSLICDAMAIALERLDQEVVYSFAPEITIHDVRSRSLVTEVGAVTFNRRVCRDTYKNPITPLDEFLDIPYGARISPGAFSFLVEAGAEVSYAKAARLLSRRTDTKISATTVMRAMRRVGDMLEDEAVSRAHDLYELGIKPKGDKEAEELCLEADGTWIAIQGQDTKVEIKALVAYEGKTKQNKKVKRTSPVRFGCVGSPNDFWTQGIATIGIRYDLSKIKQCHLGTDGAAWCKAGGNYLRGDIGTIGHLDPFHINRAIGRCFSEPQDTKEVLECIWAGDVEGAADMLEAFADQGIAREKLAYEVCRYLRSNASIISVPGPSLGTMEAENQHLYKSRMASVPCAWSVEGASDMARIRSTVFSKEPLPMPKRGDFLSESRRKRRQKRIEKGFVMKDYMPLEYVGSGYEPPQGSLSDTGKSHQVRFMGGLYKDRRVL